MKGAQGVYGRRVEGALLPGDAPRGAGGEESRDLRGRTAERLRQKNDKPNADSRNKQIGTHLDSLGNT